MSESRLLQHLREYFLDVASLSDAIDHDPDRAFELLSGAAFQDPAWFDDDTVALLVRRVDRSPRHVFTILHALAERDAARAPRMMDLFRENFARFPSDAIDALYYVCTNDPPLLTRPLVDLLCANAPSNPYQAFSALQHVLARRPELVTERVVDTVLRHLHLAVNQAFYFVREAVKRRPEFVPLCTLALFDCVLKEPHPFVKREMIKDIVAIASGSHVKTGLEKALREPPAGGSHLARSLMAILFRQRFRARQRVLLEALDLAAQWPAVWDFFLFVLDRPDLKQVSSAAAEQYLESVYRLHLIVTSHEFERIVIARLDLRRPPEIAFPEDVAFLSDERDLLALYRRVAHLAARLDRPFAVKPLDDFRSRLSSAGREREAIAKLRAGATTRRRKKMEARHRSLDERMGRWSDAAYRRAFNDRAAEAKLPEPARVILRRERRELAKKVSDALHAAAPQMALDALGAATMDAYRAAVRNVLGRDADLSKLDPAVLPSFMYYEKIGRFPNNRKYLARLIEDRLAGRPHEWLWTEPPVMTFVEKVRAATPSIRLDRWRAPFSRDYACRPGDAGREKRRRVEKDLAQTRALFVRAKIEIPEAAGYDDLRRAFLEIRAKPPKEADPQLLSEIETNLERIRLTEQSAESDYEGSITLEVESDPFQVLFMGEFGFASCLSIRGSNVWSAVSNAIDVDKAVVWAKESGGNIVGRRLIALTPEGILSFRTYANRHGLALDGFFEKFLDEYAAHCGTKVTHGAKSGPLLSDQWYDDGAL